MPNLARKKGKKNRKHGRGVRKAERSRFKSYAGIFQHSQEMKENRMAKREKKFAKRRKNRRKVEIPSSQQTNGAAETAPEVPLLGEYVPYKFDFVVTQPPAPIHEINHVFLVTFREPWRTFERITARIHDFFLRQCERTKIMTAQYFKDYANFSDFAKTIPVEGEFVHDNTSGQIHRSE